MQKKDIGLLVLILVVGAVVALINPRFLSPINIANTANLIGLFGIFAIAQAFVIVTGGIDLSVGSVIALLGVLFVDMVVDLGVPWPLALLTVILLGGADRRAARLSHHQDGAATLRRDALRPAGLSRRRALLYRRRDRRLHLRPDISATRMAGLGTDARGSAQHRRLPGRRGGGLGGDAPLGLRAASVRGRARTRRPRGFPASAPTG